MKKCFHFDSNLGYCRCIIGCRNMGRPETEKDIKIYDICKGYTKICKYKRTK